MDNREFNIKGKTKKQLALALNCLLATEYDDSETVVAWYINQKKGFVLCSYKKEYSTAFTNRLGQNHPITEAELVDVLWDWLNGLKKEEIMGFTNPNGEEDEESGDHYFTNSDVSMDLGWRLYNEAWGHIKNGEHTIDHSTIAAFKPSWCWYGK